MWKTVKLGHLLEVQNGYAFNSKQFDADGDMPLIRIRDLKNAITTETRYTGEYDEKYVVKNGDLLIGMDGEFRCYEWRGESALLNQRVCRLQNFHTDLNQRFLLYSINDVLKKIEDMTGFTTVKHLSSKTITQIELPLPPLAEQQRIVAKLDAAFAEIDRAIQLEDEKEAKAKNLERRLLESVFSIPYPVAKVGDLGDLKSGGTPSSKEDAYWNGNIPWYSSGELNHLFTSKSEKFITTAGLNNSNAKLFPAGTLLIGMYDTAAMKMSILRQEATFNQAIVGIPPNDFATAEYLFYALKFLKPKILLERKGVRQQNLSLAKIKNIDVPLPNALVQKQVVEQLNAFHVEHATYQNAITKKRERLKSLKSALLSHELQPPQSKVA